MDSNYEQSAFDKLRWPIHLIDEADNLDDKLPELKKYPEFKADVAGIDRNCLIRYIVYSYDKNSPLFQDLDEVLKRKVTAARYAGFKQDDDMKFDKRVEQIFGNEIPEVNKMIIRYARLQNSLDFSLLVAGLDHYYGLLYDLQNTQIDSTNVLKTGQDKNKLFKECRLQLNELRLSAVEVFGESGLLDDLDIITQEADPTLIKGSFVEHYAKAKKKPSSGKRKNRSSKI